MSGPRQGSLFGRRHVERQAEPQTQTPAEPAPDEPRLLHIGAAELMAIARLIDKAQGEPVPSGVLQRRLKELQCGERPRRNREFTIEIPFGFAVTYTIEELGDGMARHLAVSVDRAGRRPTSEAMLMLARAFGFRAQKLSDCDAIWFEPLGNDRSAVNLVELITVDGGYIPDPENEDEEE